MNALLKFPRPEPKIENEKPMFSDKFDNGYVMSSRLYRKEVMPFLSDAARNVYAELEMRINGYQKETDFVSYSQLQGDSDLTGSRLLSRPTVSNGLKELISLGVISVVGTGKQGTKSYKLNEISLKDRFANETSVETKPVQLVNQSSVETKPKLVSLLNSQYKERKKKENIYKFSFIESLKNLGAEDQLIQDWLVVRKTKKASNSETAFKGFDRELKKSNLDVNTVLRICIERSWQGFTASWLNNIDLSSYQTQVEVMHSAQVTPTNFKGVRKSFKGMDQ